MMIPLMAPTIFRSAFQKNMIGDPDVTASITDNEILVSINKMRKKKALGPV